MAYTANKSAGIGEREDVSIYRLARRVTVLEGRGETLAEKQNCWEFKQCGREPGGINAAEKGICPAATEERLHGIHGGKNAGRCCWVVAGPLCDHAERGTFARKEDACIECDFYELVEREVGPDFIVGSRLFQKMK